MAKKQAVELVVVPGTDEVTHAVEDVEVGTWYWVSPVEEETEEPEEDEDEEYDEDIDYEDEGEARAPWLGCVVHRGSNYILMEGIYSKERIHVNDFWKRCKLEPHATDVLEGEVRTRQERVRQLMAKVQEITEELSLGKEDADGGGTTQALSTLHVNINKHKKALVKAKDHQLPALFKEIEYENKKMAEWMTAKLIPLRAQARGMKKVVGIIEARIFHVELYAGLTEEVVQVKEGTPAPKDTKLHLIQRRHYMDEECLLDYKAGGMNFQKIGDFDKWLRKQKNFNRLFPFPRCMLAFRVRRNKKDYGKLDAWIRVHFEDADEQTFLYIRNGQQLWRLNTAIEFGESLFPEVPRLQGQVYIRGNSGAWTFIDEAEYQGRKETYVRRLKKYQDNVRKAKKMPKDKQYKETAKTSWSKDWALRCFMERNEMKPSEKPEDRSTGFEHFDHEHLYYDDASEYLKKSIDEYNRIALLLQGLYDRSPVLHPHPKVKLWDPKGFDDALVLVRDDHMIEPKHKPDFEAYRKRLNKQIEQGSITIGQQRVWLKREREREYERRSRSWRYRGGLSDGLDYYRPEGDSGPGTVARVYQFKKRVKECVYRWTRERLSAPKWPYNQSEEVNATITVPVGKLFNVSAYKPGDFLQFYQDHRTRAEYLKWAPYLLTAEDYYAGKIKVQEPEKVKK